jgi:hypothetical protein
MGERDRQWKAIPSSTGDYTTIILAQSILSERAVWKPGQMPDRFKPASTLSLYPDAPAARELAGR